MSKRVFPETGELKGKDWFYVRAALSLRLGAQMQEEEKGKAS